MFLSNTPLRYPPLKSDMEVAGLLLPKGTEVLKNKDEIIAVVLPKPWKFKNKSCAAGTVSMKTWDRKPGAPPEVFSCQKN